MDNNPAGTDSPKGPSLKKRAGIIGAGAAVSYAMIILLVATSAKPQDEWLLVSAYYTPSTGSLAVNYHDTLNHTQEGTVSLQSSNEVWHVGDFTGSQHGFLVNANEMASVPETVTIQIKLSDGTVLTRTVDVQVLDSLNG